MDTKTAPAEIDRTAEAARYARSTRLWDEAVKEARLTAAMLAGGHTEPAMISAARYEALMEQWRELHR